MQKRSLQVIEGGKIKPATVRRSQIIEAHGRWTRALKPISLSVLAWELSMSQQALAVEFREIDQEQCWAAAYRAGRASLWRAA